MKQFTLWLAVLLLAGCATQRNAQKYYNKHPAELASVCADKFPVRDCTIDKTKYVPADNKNYTGIIDSLQKEVNKVRSAADEMAEQLAGQVTPDSLAACKAVLALYQKTISNLQSKIDGLKGVYKPCEPDTVFKDRIVYRENTARVAAQAAQIAELTASRDKYKEERDEARKTAKNRLFALFAVCGVAAVSIYLWIKK